MSKNVLSYFRWKLKIELKIAGNTPFCGMKLDDVKSMLMASRSPSQVWSMINVHFVKPASVPLMMQLCDQCPGVDFVPAAE
jgi:hypothetical protein